MSNGKVSINNACGSVAVTESLVTEEPIEKVVQIDTKKSIKDCNYLGKEANKSK